MRFLDFQQRMRSFPLFSILEIEKYFPGFDSRRLVEWQQKGYIQKIRNRYYRFSDQPESEAYLYYVANQIYHPSYISLESALSKYNFIPETTFQIISCTTLKTNAFDTPLGIFTYRHIKPSLFFGYRLHRWNNHHYVLASPEKALLDYLYLHSEIEQVEDLESLRWNAHEIHSTIDLQRLTMYEHHINSTVLSQRVQILNRYLHAFA